MILRVPDDALLLRAARMKRADFPDEMYRRSRSRIILIETFAPMRGPGL